MTSPDPDIPDPKKDPGPGGGRRDHRDDGCWLTLAKPVFILTLLILTRKKVNGSSSS